MYQEETEDQEGLCMCIKKKFRCHMEIDNVEYTIGHESSYCKKDKNGSKITLRLRP